MRSSKSDSLNKKEFEKLWEAATKGDELDRLIFVLAGHLGMRVSEITHLKKSWIDFGGQRVRIPYEENSWKAKSKAAARTIPYGKMNPRVQEELENYFKYHNEIPITRRAIWHRIKNLAYEASLTKNVYPHSLRATAAFQFADAGFSAQALRQIMGWEKLETAESYINQSGRAAEREMEEKGDKLW